MRRHGIRAIITTDSRHDFPIAPNLLERNFIAAAPNRIWLADITYVETDQGWLYLATGPDATPWLRLRRLPASLARPRAVF